MAVALDDSAEAAQEWVDAADPRPSFPVLLDRDLVVAEAFGITNVPTTVWIDEADRVVRPPVIAPADDTFREFSGVDSSVHHDQLRRWVREGTIDFDVDAADADQVAVTDELQLARLERRVGAHLARTGSPEAAVEHFDRAAALAPMDWTVRRGTLPLRGQDPFGQPFFDFWQEWSEAGRPGYRSADAPR